MAAVQQRFIARRSPKPQLGLKFGHFQNEKTFTSLALLQESSARTQLNLTSRSCNHGSSGQMNTSNGLGASIRQGCHPSFDLSVRPAASSSTTSSLQQPTSTLINDYLYVHMYWGRAATMHRKSDTGVHGFGVRLMQLLRCYMSRDLRLWSHAVDKYAQNLEADPHQHATPCNIM